MREEEGDGRWLLEQEKKEAYKRKGEVEMCTTDCFPFVVLFSHPSTSFNAMQKA